GPLARYYTHPPGERPDPNTATHFGPVWRPNRPQNRRLCQLTHRGIGILGVVAPMPAVQVILATCGAVSGLRLERPRIRLNDRRILSAMASFCGVEPARHGDFFITLDKLDKIGREGVERELREGGYDAGAISKLFTLVLSSDGGSSGSL